ncbi:MAG: hypothetical protein JO356_03210 [Acidobacteria bacterium]|nr:hypothetical protein [Acidobacteriota bacterium]
MDEKHEDEVVDHVLRRLFNMDARRTKRRVVANRDLVLRFREDRITATLRRRGGEHVSNVTWKLRRTENVPAEIVRVRNEIIDFAKRKGAAEAEIDAIPRRFRKERLFVRQRPRIILDGVNSGN